MAERLKSAVIEGKSHFVEERIFCMRLLTIAAVSLLAFSSSAFARYQITVSEAMIADKRTDANGQLKDWDIGVMPIARPDAYVVIEVNGQPIYVSAPKGDNTNPRWFTGSAWWRLPTTAAVRVRVVESDAGKLVAGVGIAGVALRPDVPGVGKRLVGNALANVDTDDAIATWTGTLGQLIDTLGGTGRFGELVKPGDKRMTVNNGLKSLKLRILERDADFDVSKPKGNGSVIGIASARIALKRKSNDRPWDPGFGQMKSPDPRYIIYVNGEPVMVGATNKDSYAAAWAGTLPGLDLRDEDQVAILLYDADVGAILAKAGKQALLFERNLGPQAKGRVLEQLNKANDDDLIYCWVGSWKTLRGMGKSVDLASRDMRAGVWTNDGLLSAKLMLANEKGVNLAAKPKVVRIGQVALTDRQPNGKKWDGFGKADPAVIVSVEAQGGAWAEVAKTKEHKDSPSFDAKLRLNDKRLIPGRRIKIDVWEKDRTGDDLAATFVLKIPEAGATKTLKDAGVKSLVVVIE